MSERPRTRQELYDRIRATSKEQYILEEMVRLGFWGRDESRPEDPANEVKRRGEIDGVEQLSRYLDLLNRDPVLAPVRGVLAAQEIRPQARTLATDRGIACTVLDYDALRGLDDPDSRLF